VQSRGSNENHEPSDDPLKRFQWLLNVIEFSGEGQAPLTRFLWPKAEGKPERGMGQPESQE